MGGKDCGRSRRRREREDKCRDGKGGIVPCMLGGIDVHGDGHHPPRGRCGDRAFFVILASSTIF